MKKIKIADTTLFNREKQFDFKICPEILFVDKKISMAIRGIAAVMIMLSHINGSIMALQLISPGELWVGIFFFYSGYGLQYSYDLHPDSYLNGFIKKKFSKYMFRFSLQRVYIQSAFCIGKAISV